MPTTVTPVEGQNIIFATQSGPVLDLESAKGMLNDIRLAAETLADYKVVIDTRNAECKLQVNDYWYWAEELENFRDTFSRRVAVVAPLNLLDEASFFAHAARFRGFVFHAFSSFEEAIDWLIHPRRDL